MIDLELPCSFLSHTHTHTQFARTDWIKNNINPEFSKAIEMNYRFEEVQKLRYAVPQQNTYVPELYILNSEWRNSQWTFHV